MFISLKQTQEHLVQFRLLQKHTEPYVNYATKVMLGHNKVTDFTFNPQLKGFAIKQPVFFQ
jgi:carbamoyl-phosphate synthase large subunit